MHNCKKIKKIKKQVAKKQQKDQCMVYLVQQGSGRRPLSLLPDPPPLLHPVGARVREHLSHLINSGVGMKGILILQR